MFRNMVIDHSWYYQWVYNINTSNSSIVIIGIWIDILLTKMKINNAGEFFHFVRNNALMGMAPETAGLVVCMEEYGRMCACDPATARNAKLNQCRGLYLAFASQAAKYKAVMFSKIGDPTITFTIDGQQIITLSR